ncbi:MAG: metalloregulator ArsR/SmtB family transcription factor [Anaerolineae bacterium]|nr:metalloregulator ArsR/SmtB family transcription factor [Anaerolineae bacterium]MDW8102806.1 metalloregulator ArsR/SmtB family transcription factor [Anaerolineae bacterium]
MAITDELQREIVLLHAQICQGLADPKRILILYALADGPRCVTELTEILGFPQPTISHHLKILRERGLVVARQEGPVIRYALADKRVLQALNLLREVLRDRLTQQAHLLQQV